MAPEHPDLDDPLLDRLREALRGEYDVERRLGAGGMGYVYLGRDVALDMPVAIKVLRPELATARAAERFLSEARALAAVKHQNVVTIHRVPQDTHGLFLYVMELLGATLADRLRNEPLGVREAVRVGMDLLAGLERVHQAAIVHRDIKPANVFVQERGPAKIGDFGIAHVSRASGEAVTEPGGTPGTPAYQAPEQAAGREVGPAADLYATGMVLYEALTGRRWLGGCDPARADWRRVQRRIRPVLRRALAVDPALRWPDARAFRHALAGTLRRRNPMAIAAVAAGVAVTSGIAWVIWIIVHDHPVPPSALAVLPFNVEGGPARTGEQLAIAVETNLAAAWGDSGFADTAYTLTLPYARDRARDSLPADAWDALHTARIMRGRVEIRGDSMLVTAELVEPGHAARALGRVQAPVDAMPRVGYRLAQAVARTLEPALAARFTGYRSEQGDAATAAFIDGAYAFEQDNWDAAEAAYRDAIAADSNYADAWWGLYKVQSWRRATHEVDLAAVYARDAGKFGELDRLLIQAELAPTISARIALYRRAIERAPYDAYPRLMLGNELFHRGAFVGHGFDSAIEELNRAVQANQYLAATYSMLAWAHTRLGNAAEARHALEQHRTYGRPQPEDDFSMLDVLMLAWEARFAPPEQAARRRDEILGSADGAESLARAARLGLAFGLPGEQLAIGEALAASTRRDLRVLGLTTQAPALLSQGRVREALARLGESARVAGDPEHAFQAAEWALALAALGVPGVPTDTLRAARTLLRSWAGAGPLVPRARWVLLLDAIATDTNLAERALTDLAEAPAARALVDLGTALVHAMRGDTAAALRLSDSLTQHVVAAEIADPLQRAVLFLSRGRWLAGRDQDGADAAWRWYENADFAGWPVGHVQAAELDWALETYARYLRAGLARDRRDARRACAILPDAVRRWAQADSAYAPVRATLDAWARDCAAS